MGIKQNVREIVVDVLLQCEQRHIFVNLALKNNSLFNRLSDMDKALGYRLIYGVLQNQLLLDYQINQYLRKDITKLHPVIRVILRVVAYQLIFMDKIPAHAACNEAVELCKRRHLAKLAGLVNAVSRKLTKLNSTSLVLPDKSEDLSLYLSVVYSHPLWLVEKWLKDWGIEATTNILETNNKIIDVTIRVNSAVTDIATVKHELEIAGYRVNYGQLHPEIALRLDGAGDITATKLFETGRITIQDEGAIHAVKQLDLRKGLRILDMCSAPGGKTSLIANLLQNDCEIIAVDVYPHRLKLVQEVCERLHVDSVQLLLADATSLRDIGSFDRILLDAPCTGLGTIRTKPEIRWYRQMSDIQQIAITQRQLLKNASHLLKPGGKIVYSTCSLEKEETSDVTNSCATLELQSDEYIFPHLFNTEGFYIAVLTKKM